MNTLQLAEPQQPDFQIEEFVLNAQVGEISHVEHMQNYGRAAFGLLSEKVSEAAGAIESLLGNVAGRIDEMPRPTRVATVAGVLGAAISVAPAAAQRADTTGRASLTSTPSFKYYPPGSKEGIRLIHKGEKKCLPQGMTVDPNGHLSNPSGRIDRKFAKGWFTFGADGKHQVAHIRYKTPYKPCFKWALTENYGTYIIDPSQVKKVKNGEDIIDPIPRHDTSGQAIRSVEIAFKK